MFEGKVRFDQNKALLTSARRTLGEHVNALSHAGTEEQRSLESPVKGARRSTAASGHL